VSREEGAKALSTPADVSAEHDAPAGRPASTTGRLYDLVIHAGRVVCPATGLDGPGAVAIAGHRIAAAGPAVGGAAREVLRFPDAVLLPGLIDLHAHPARGESKYGVDPDLHLLPYGTTTVLSQGDAGALNQARYRESVIAASRTRVRLALNLSRRGEAMDEGCFESLDDADVAACVRAAREPGGGLWGISVNVSPIACGRTDPRAVMARALAAAEETGLPLLFGSRRHDDWALDEQLALLRPGDVVTYCFTGQHDGLVVGGRVRAAAWAARERGVLFDVGHGMNSFSFDVAERAVADGFLPDTISTDRYVLHLDGSPRHDLPRTLSKLIAVGMPEAEAFLRVTARPAAVLRLSGEVGTLAPGAAADLAVLGFDPAAAPLRDTAGAGRPGGAWEPVLTVCAGYVMPR
jgi:dihydroorotase